MLDRLHLFIPFHPDHISLIGDVDGCSDPLHLVDLSTLGVPLQAEITLTDSGAIQAEYMRHAWESLGTGYTPMAMKVFHQSLGKRLMPGIELKASPAKLLQGHNVFGPTSIRSGAEIMWKWLGAAYPKLCSKLNLPSAQVYSFDCTYSSRLPDERTALQVIQSLVNVSNGHTKSRGDNYRTSAYWGSKESRLKKLKAYLKHTEFEAQLDEVKKRARFDTAAARTLSVMSDERLRDWVKYLLRMEATVMHRWLERRSIPTNLFDLIFYQENLLSQNRCLIQECWQEVTKDLFKAFAGAEMRIIDDEKVLKSLKLKHIKIGRNGKPNESYALNLFRTYRSIKDYGFEETMNSMSRASFYRHVSDICSAGISKAMLQKLSEHDRKNNVVPLLRFVSVDFGAQRPDWYVEPTADFA